jgi:hypothetical protein
LTDDENREVLLNRKHAAIDDLANATSEAPNTTPKFLHASHFVPSFRSHGPDFNDNICS